MGGGFHAFLGGGVGFRRDVDGCAFWDIFGEGVVVFVDEACGDGELGLTAVAQVLILGSTHFIGGEVGKRSADVSVERCPS